MHELQQRLSSSSDHKHHGRFQHSLPLSKPHADFSYGQPQPRGNSRNVVTAQLNLTRPTLPQTVSSAENVLLHSPAE